MIRLNVVQITKKGEQYQSQSSRNNKKTLENRDESDNEGWGSLEDVSSNKGSSKLSLRPLQLNFSSIGGFDLLKRRNSEEVPSPQSEPIDGTPPRTRHIYSQEQEYFVNI